MMLYTPLHTIIWQTPGGGTRFTFDRPRAQLASFGTPQITEVGREHGHKPAALLDHLGLEVPDHLTGSSETGTHGRLVDLQTVGDEACQLVLAVCRTVGGQDVKDHPAVEPGAGLGQEPAQDRSGGLLGLSAVLA